MSSEVEIQPWSATEYSNLALVQEIKKHPCLYNNTLPEYSRKDITGKIWQDIADKFGCTVSKLRIKWKNIRAVYFRTKFRQCRGDKTNKRRHYLEKHLSFILPFTQSRKLMKELASLSKGKSIIDSNCEQTTSSNVENNIALELPRNSGSNQITNDLKTKTRQVKAVKPTIVNCVGSYNQPESSENWQNNSAPTETYFIAPYEKNSACFSLADSEDFRKQFMMSLLPEIEEMPEPKFRSFKRQILHLIDDIKAND